jgi:hypothetical protein
MSKFGMGEFFSGLKEAIYEPIKEDVKDAYWVQRAARTRYPGADGIFNFLPYVGAATVADDMAQSLYQEGTIHNSDLIEAAINRSTMGLAGKGAVNSFRSLGQYGQNAKNQVISNSKGNKTGDRAQAATLVAGGIPLGLVAALTPMAYYGHYANRQENANKQYGDLPLYKIAEELQAKSK